MNNTEFPKVSKMEVPKFIQEPAKLTKPNEGLRHNERLTEIYEHMDEEDARVACKQLAKKYPMIVLESVIDELNSAREILSTFEKMMDKYENR